MYSFATNLCTNNLYNLCFQYIVEKLVDLPCVYLIFTFEENFQFNYNLANSLNGKPIIIFDFSEESWQTSWNNELVLGANPDFGVRKNQNEYYKLHEWLLKQNIVGYFKREFSIKIQNNIENYNLKFPIFPIEAPIYDISTTMISKKQWFERKGQVLHIYGNTHADRRLMHFELQKQSHYVVNNLSMVNKLLEHDVDFHCIEEVPSEIRYQLNEIFAIQNNFLLSCALPGLGVKCWRNIESCVNTVPIYADLGTKWSVPFDESNSVVIPSRDGRINFPESIEIINNALKDKENLYKKSIVAYETCKQYQLTNYMSKFINSKIKKIF